MDQEISMNWEHFHVEPSIRLNVTNETLADEELMVVWALRDNTGKILREERTEVKVPVLSSCWLKRLELLEVSLRTEYVCYEV